MIHIYYTHFNYKWNESYLNCVINQLSVIDQTKALKFIRWEDRQASILSRLLLKHCLFQRKSNYTIHDISIAQNGKPYIKNGPCFNISHSGKYVVCIISEHVDVGIDIEEVSEINVNEFKSIFTENEWMLIQNSKEKSLVFYEIWTKKEAIIKADGRGLDIALSKVDTVSGQISFNENKWLLQSVFIDPLYICNFASMEATKYILEEVTDL